MNYLFGVPFQTGFKGNYTEREIHAFKKRFPPGIPPISFVSMVPNGQQFPGFLGTPMTGVYGYPGMAYQPQVIPNERVAATGVQNVLSKMQKHGGTPQVTSSSLTAMFQNSPQSSRANIAQSARSKQGVMEERQSIKLPAYPPPQISQETINEINSWFSSESPDTKRFSSLLKMLKESGKTEEAIEELAKARESKFLAYLLWYSPGVIAILIQELVSFYPNLSPTSISHEELRRLSNILALLQCLTLEPTTRSLFLNSNMHLLLFPFLRVGSKSRNFEQLRLTSLGVIGALVKGDDTEIIEFLKQTEIIPLCLRIMRRGQDLSRTVATFIVQKIISDPKGFEYICSRIEIVDSILTILAEIVESITKKEGLNFLSLESQRLLRFILRIYLKLSENTKVANRIARQLPETIINNPLPLDENSRKTQCQLLKNLLKACQGS